MRIKFLENNKEYFEFFINNFLLNTNKKKKFIININKIN